MLTQSKYSEIAAFAKQIRIETIRQMMTFGKGHAGGSMSIADIVAVLYGEVMHYDPKNPKDPDRDWLICSKGHAGPAIYSALALKGFFPMEWLQTLNQSHTNLPSHCDRNKTPGIDVTTGSLGQGLGVACGVAISNKMDGRDSHVFCIIGDGESQEGQIWEAVMLAAHRKLDNLIVLVDSNKLQIDGTCEQVCGVESFSEKFRAFHWNAIEIDGHDYNAIYDAICQAYSQQCAPTAIICNTIKGKGVEFAQGQFGHHLAITQEMGEAAIAALENA